MRMASEGSGATRTPAGPATANLDPLLNPRAVAVVGASLTNPNNVGSRALRQLRRFADRDVYQVHPRARSNAEALAVQAVTDLPDHVDLLIVALPVDNVVPVVRQAAEHGIGAALIFTSGFAEGGEEGERAQVELGQIADAHGMLINGPNTIGFLNLHEGLLATFYLPNDVEPWPAGSVAIVSQSGALATYTEGLARDRGINPGWLVTTGNEAGVQVTDVLAYLVERPEVEVLFATSEGVRDAEAFVSVATRAAELGKPLVMVKAGRSEAGLAAAMSHTAAISGADEVFDAICVQYGVLRATGLEEALDWLSVLQTGRRLAGDRVALLTGSGGAGVMMADASIQAGLAVATTPESDQEAIHKLIPSFGSAVNPVDVTAQAIASGLENYQRIVDTLIHSQGFDAVVVSSGLRDGQDLEVAAKVADSYQTSDKPIVVNWYSTNQASRQRLVQAGVPTFSDIGRAVGALGALRRFQELKVDAQPVVVPDPGRVADVLRDLPAYAGPLTEVASKTLLASFGLPVLAERVAADPAEAALFASEGVTSPLVLKLVSPDVPHKSDIGGVRLGLGSADEVHQAGVEILASAAQHAPTARVEGLLVQQMAPPGIEMMVGMHRDPVFGPVVTVGLGGVLVEILSQVALRKAPLSTRHARQAIADIAGGRLAAHSRGLKEGQVEQLAQVLVSVGRLAIELPQVQEIDINPIIASQDRLVIVDALVVLK